MLHILLLILKVIGIILAVILGILLLLISIVLFVPIRYEVSAKCDGTVDSLRAKAKVTWLLHLLRADVFVKGKKLKWQIRAAWIKKSSFLSFGEEKEGTKNEVQKEEFIHGTEKVEHSGFKDEVCEETSDISKEEPAENEEAVKEHRLEETCEEKKVAEDSVLEESKKESFVDKIKKLIEKLKTSIQNICEKISDLMQKKEKITDFLTEESHVNAFKKVKKALFILLKRWKPKNINLKLHFGFDDPSTTGKVLAGLSILYPIMEDSMEIIPDFEEQIFEGKGSLKGKIRICHCIWMALKLLLSKDVRKSYKDIREFKL